MIVVARGLKKVITPWIKLVSPSLKSITYAKRVLSQNRPTNRAKKPVRVLTNFPSFRISGILTNIKFRPGNGRAALVFTGDFPGNSSTSPILSHSRLLVGSGGDCSRKLTVCRRKRKIKAETNYFNRTYNSVKVIKQQYIQKLV